FIEKVKREGSRHRALIGAHAMMSLNDDTLDALRDLSESADTGIHMHVAEDMTDLLDSEKIHATTLAARLERIGVARKGSVVAHAVQLGNAEVDDLVACGAFIATNPRSN